MLEEFDKKIQELQVEKMLEAEKMLEGDNPENIIKASNFMQKEIKNIESESKSYLFAPDGGYDRGMPFKKPHKGVSLEVLARVRKVPQVFSIINTRMDQVQKFLQFTTDDQKEGFTIRIKPSLFEETKKAEKYSDTEKKDIEYIYNFLEFGGEKGKWEQTDDLSSFVRKILFDSLSMDQATFEIGRTKAGQPVDLFAVDASTIRVLQTVDPAERDKYKAEEVNGILPSYCQVFLDNIVKDQKNNQVLYYPWELAFLVRNPDSSLYANGYGTSEIEIAMNIITWMLWSMEYNGNFFKQGSAPRGFFTYKGNADERTVSAFKQQWRGMMSGVKGAHKIPFFEGGDLEWQDMQTTNRDMEYQQWNELLLLILCSVYKIDPSELGFNFQNQSQFGQDGQKERLDHSKKKGLEPILIFLEKAINKYIVSELKDGKYEFKFTGVDLEDEGTILDNDVKKVTNGMVSQGDMFAKYSGRKFDEKTDVILNSVYAQIQQSKQFGGEETNEAVADEFGGEENGVQNPFEMDDAMEKSMSSNPILRETMNYAYNLFTEPKK